MMSKNSIVPFLKDYLIKFLTRPFLLDTNVERVFILIRPQLDANERKWQKKYKEKMSRENFFEKSNEFSEKTEIYDDSIIQIANDIEYK